MVKLVVLEFFFVPLILSFFLAILSLDILIALIKEVVCIGYWFQFTMLGRGKR